MDQRQCAYLTMENPEGFFVYDELTYGPMRNLGWNVEAVPWSRPTKSWDEYDAVVIRSTWDYQDHAERFLQTLTDIEDAQTPLLNSRETCRWNMDKVYLRHLFKAGVPIIPTLWFDRLDDATIHDCLKRFDSGESIVVKPRIGANADNIFVLDHSEATWHEATQVFADSPLMVQPFLNTIRSLGEYSLFYFGGEYSHAILKRPKSGDYRVQEEHGGRIAAVEAPAEVKRLAELGLEAIESELDEELLYARLDVVQLDEGPFALIEAELIEPSLYFNFDAESSRRFATVLNRMVS